jgi:hypothetical protein
VAPEYLSGPNLGSARRHKRYRPWRRRLPCGGVEIVGFGRALDIRGIDGETSADRRTFSRADFFAMTTKCYVAKKW